MRHKLKELGLTTFYDFTGTVGKFGKRFGYSDRYVSSNTILLFDVKVENFGADIMMVSDHLWFVMTEDIIRANLQIGDVISFIAHVVSYERGYKGYDYVNQCPRVTETDYTLSPPMNIKKISKVALNASKGVVIRNDRSMYVQN